MFKNVQRYWCHFLSPSYIPQSPHIEYPKKMNIFKAHQAPTKATNSLQSKIQSGSIKTTNKIHISKRHLLRETRIKKTETAVYHRHHRRADAHVVHHYSKIVSGENNEGNKHRSNRRIWWIEEKRTTIVYIVHTVSGHIHRWKINFKKRGIQNTIQKKQKKEKHLLIHSNGKIFR